MVHVILDNYAAHKHPKVRAWLDRHERFVFYANLMLLAQRGRGLLRQAVQAPLVRKRQIVMAITEILRKNRRDIPAS